MQCCAEPGVGKLAPRLRAPWYASAQVAENLVEFLGEVDAKELASW